MENQETVVTQTTQPAETTSTQTASNAIDTATVDAKTQGAEIPQGQAASTAYVPNYKFKVGDEEKEFDDFVRPIIDRKDVEEKLREIYTKAHGLEPAKARLKTELDDVRAEAGTFKEKYANLQTSLGRLSHLVNTDDFDSFFQSLKIPEQKLFKWMQRKIKEQEMPPEERQEIARQRNENARLYDLELQNKSLQEKIETWEKEQNYSRLNTIIAGPEVSPIAQAFDAKVGTPGAFYNEVLKRGVALYHIYGKDLPPDQVVADVMATIGKIVPVEQSAAGQDAAMSTKPAVIPNVSGKSTSPVKKAPRSLSELKQLAETM